MRISRTFEITDTDFQSRLLAWASKQETFCVLNSNCSKQEFQDKYAKHDFITAVGCVDQIHNSHPESIRDAIRNSFGQLQQFHDSKKDWLLGFLTYDLKNELEDLKSENKDGQEFPEFHFFQPRFILKLQLPISQTGKQTFHLEVFYLDEYDNCSSVDQIVQEIKETKVYSTDECEAEIQPTVSKEEYISIVNEIKKHIQRGDIYEMNYCVEFGSENSTIDPVAMYQKLNELSPMPFSSLYRMSNHYLLCASPERFVAKRDRKIISQPIKGTAKRGKTPAEDERIKFLLKNDPKEQSENVMIVDLVRNDLSRTAKKGSVHVEELFGIYTFRQLHQMISTVVSEVKENLGFSEVIRQAFPMGSMTGAPKVRAMQLIEKYEKTKRGLYSGSVGYIDPDGDFDFNVVIRSILYNESNRYLSFMAGSAITINSDPEKEYEECLLKAKAMMQVLNAEYKV